MKRSCRLLCVAALVGGLGAAKPAFSAPSSKVDIGGNGAPTLTGNVGGSVTGSTGLLADLLVTINFGEISALNQSGIIRAVVPIAIRSTGEYQLNVSLEGTSFNVADSESLQLTDIGFGIQNFGPAGANANICSNNTINAPFFNDPSLTVNVTNRASYPSSLANIAGTTMVMFGPKLSRGPVNPRTLANGWAFEAIFTIVPQFFSPGTSSVTIRFTVSDYPTVIKCI